MAISPEVVWIVEGMTGEYSDHHEWPVAAYFDESLAKQHVELATRRAKEIEAARESCYHVAKETNEYDPAMSMDYTGTQYTAYPVIVLSALPSHGDKGSDRG